MEAEVVPRILDLDGSLISQTQLGQRLGPAVYDLRHWGPRLRLGCGFRRFGQFEATLANALGSPADERPAVSFVGSGDFHHVSLALLRRIECPFNLLILDKHPDWMGGIPFLHCGSWVHHAVRLANVRKIYHVGGDLDFDNGFRLLAPWRHLRSGKIRVISASRRWERGEWKDTACPLLRSASDSEATSRQIEDLIAPFRNELARWPLYISLDKDVLNTNEAVVNWDSGNLTLAEVHAVLTTFAEAANHQLAGMDVVGDWSPVRLRGLGRHLLHLTEHPRLNVQHEEATRCNQRTNLALLEWVKDLAGDGVNGADMARIAA
jgi:hypothetical protein